MLHLMGFSSWSEYWRCVRGDRAGWLGVLLVLLVVALGLATPAPGWQTAAPSYQLPLWVTGAKGYIYPLLGKSFYLKDGAVEVLLAPPRTYGVELVYAPGTSGAPGRWPLPAGARNIAVHVNGFRYKEGRDYRIDAGALIAIGVTQTEGGSMYNMNPPDLVVIDFDR